MKIYLTSMTRKLGTLKYIPKSSKWVNCELVAKIENNGNLNRQVRLLEAFNGYKSGHILLTSSSNIKEDLIS